MLKKSEDDQPFEKRFRSSALFPAPEQNASYDVICRPYPEVTVEVVDGEGKPIDHFDLYALYTDRSDLYPTPSLPQDREAKFTLGNGRLRQMAGDADLWADSPKAGEKILTGLIPGREATIFVTTKDGRAGKTAVTLQPEEKRRFQVAVE